ncbi:hypothetical protein L1281_001291 [Neisseria sp. HSC-16F19]|nr:Imm70 family immunity protein [Neisseria sp. HSC-16F19]MCP2040702.1 hypothetical protein [Neisseria sp. HSC-16F19]
MMVGIKVGSIVDEVGSASFLNCFFSTVTALLEDGKRGARFPILSCFYQGYVHANKVGHLLGEVRVVRDELKKYPPTAVVWDLDDRSVLPPWGGNISADIKSMADYFVTSTGRDLFDLMFEALDEACEKNIDVTIVDY